MTWYNCQGDHISRAIFNCARLPDRIIKASISNKLLCHISHQDLFDITLEFSKLEKVEIGGIKGKVLSHDVIQIYNEFMESVAVFSQRTYDSLNPVDKVRTLSSTEITSYFPSISFILTLRVIIRPKTHLHTFQHNKHLFRNCVSFHCPRLKSYWFPTSIFSFLFNSFVFYIFISHLLRRLALQHKLVFQGASNVSISYNLWKRHEQWIRLKRTVYNFIHPSKVLDLETNIAFTNKDR